jgi:DNA-directed RNA polymerase specialized sigma subunit
MRLPEKAAQHSEISPSVAARSRSARGVPVYVSALLGRWQSAERLLGLQCNRSPSFDEIASSLSLSQTHRDVIAKALKVHRVELDGGSSDGGTAFANSVRNFLRGPFAELEPAERRTVLQTLLGRLEDREYAVLALRYWLEGEGPLKKEIARDWVSHVSGFARSNSVHSVRSSAPNKRAARQGLGQRLNR